MGEKQIKPLRSIVTMILIYIIFSIAGGFIGEEILHMSLIDANYFRLAIVALAFLIYLYVVDPKNILGRGQTKFGIMSILLIMLMEIITLWVVCFRQPAVTSGGWRIYFRVGIL